MKVHEFEKIVTKLDLKTRNSYDRLAWFEHEGKTITRTRRSHGSGDLPEHLIRQQLKLSQKEFAGILKCTLYRDDYVQILKERVSSKGAVHEGAPRVRIAKLLHGDRMTIANSSC